MAQEWQVEHVTGVCAVTGRKLEEGEEFYTVLFEDGESFRRADYSLDGWKEPPEGAFCCFKSRIPVREKRKRLLVDDDLLVNFFRRLAEETEPGRVQFRFVLALILMRRRRLRYEGSAVEDGAEVWTMVLPQDQSSHRVVNPRMNDDEINDVSQQLGAILHSDMQEWAVELDAAEPAAPAPDQTTDEPS